MARGRRVLWTIMAFCMSSTASSAIASGQSAPPDDPIRTQYEKSHDGEACAYSDKQIVEDGVIEPRDATDMVGLYPCWLADEDNDKARDLNDFYAHWSLRQIRSPNTTPRGYAMESRSKILRVFVGRDLSVLSSVRIEMRDPDTTIVVPLVHLGYQGRAGKPELWTTELVGDNQSTAFFRIESGTSANIILKADSTTAVGVKAAGTVLSALTSIASIANPGTGLLTTLNKESIQQTSRALDNALSSIWSNSQGEEQASGRTLSEWYPGARYILKVTIPGWVRPQSYDRTKSKDQQRFVRWYELTLSCPRRSIFSSNQECEIGNRASFADPDAVRKAKATTDQALLNLRNRVSAEQVINFKLSSGKKLQEHLASFDWYGRFLRLADAKEGKNESDENSKRETAKLREENKAPIETTVTGAAAAGDPAPVQPPGGSALAAPIARTPDVTESVNSRKDSDYASLCNSIVNELYSVGLSHIDAQIGLWAIISASSDFVGTVVEFQKTDTCRRKLPLAGTNEIWWFASSTDAIKPPAQPPTKPGRKTQKRRGIG